MDSKQSLISRVKSPAKDAHLREGKGFSLEEIKNAGKSVGLLKTIKINIDFFRKSSYPENIEKLKSLKVEKKKKKKPFVKKEKRRTPFKPKIEEIKEKEVKVIEKFPTKISIKAKQKPIKKEKIKVAKVKKEKVAKVKKEKAVKVEEVKEKLKGTPLTELSGLGAATVKKFADLGVNNIEELCKENPEELAPIIKGVSLEKLKKWIEEGKGFLK